MPKFLKKQIAEVCTEKKQKILIKLYEFPFKVLWRNVICVKRKTWRETLGLLFLYCGILFIKEALRLKDFNVTFRAMLVG